MTQCKRVTTAEPLVILNSKKKGKEENCEREVISTQWNQIFSSKDEAILELLTAKSNATYE